MSTKLITNAITTLLTLGISSASAEDGMGFTPPGMEKCYGIAKAGMNDCSTAHHNCSGEAKISGDKKEWLYMPTGLCHRIVNGNTKSDK